MIFEARPDALVQIVSLCIKSGNAIVLKGGKEAMNSNRALFKVIADALDDTPLTSSFLMLIESHEDVASILKMDKYIDLIIPRGSNAFVRYVMDNTRIPVLGHADGICSIYVDESADMDIAIPVVLDSKVQYPAACNAVEMILVNEKVKDTFLPKIKKVFDERGVIIHGDDEVRGVIECESLGSDDLFKEFLSLEVSIKCVNSINEAISLINSYGIKRLGSALSELFDSLIKELETEGKLNEQECQGECVFFNSDSSQFFRPTPDDPEEIRYSYQIPVPEALNVIIYIFQRDGKRYKKKDLLEEFSKELEYLRKGAQVVTLFNKAFAEGKEKGIISTSSSGKFYLS